MAERTRSSDTQGIDRFIGIISGSQARMTEEVIK